MSSMIYNMNIRTNLFLVFSVLSICVQSYPTRCDDLGKSQLATSRGCDIRSRPMPLIYQAEIILLQDYYWKGEEEIITFYIDDNGTYPKKDCTIAAPLPRLYKAGESLYFSENCKTFTPPMHFAPHGAHAILFVFQNEPIERQLALYFPLPYTSENESMQSISKEQKSKIFELVKEKRMNMRTHQQKTKNDLE